MTRYFYNATAGCHEPFVYGGCEGNKNNFQTLSGLLSDLLSSDSVPVVRQGAGHRQGKDWGMRWSSGDHAPVTPAQRLPP